MYILEGNIGAGKSTFLKLINQKLPAIEVAYEPLANWQSQHQGQSLLTHFYQDPARWAYTMETLTMMCRVREHRIEQQHTNPYRLVERSIYSGHYCFAKNGHEQGFMTDIEWKIYHEWFNMLIPQKCLPPLGFIYLRVDPKVSFTRIAKRSRAGESSISLGYLEQIDRRHQDFLIHKIDVLPELAQVPVLVLDCNQEFEENPKKFDEHLARVWEFMKQTRFEHKERIQASSLMVSE